MSIPPLVAPPTLPKRGTVTVAKDTWAGTETRHIDVAAWPDWFANGWRFVSAEAEPEPEPPAPRPVNTPSRDVWPRDVILRKGTQANIWAGKTQLARQSFDASANTVAAYINRPPVPRAQHQNSGKLEPSGVRAVDYLSMAYLGEGLVLALERLTVAERRIAELEARLDMEQGK